MDLDNFLAGLKRQEHKRNAKPSRGNSRDTLFMISSREDGSMWVDCVDSKLRPVQTDYHSMTGEAANAMRTIERIRERDTMRVEWGTEADDTDSVCASTKIPSYSTSSCAATTLYSKTVAMSTWRTTSTPSSPFRPTTPPSHASCSPSRRCATTCERPMATCCSSRQAR